MKTFLAIYLGAPAALATWNALSEKTRKQREAAGIEAWTAWARAHEGAIVDAGSPLGKTKRVGGDGVGDIKNSMAAYVIVRAESHEAAAKMFEKHPHFTIFPGDSVEVMECMPLPQM